MTGATGFIGRAVCRALLDGGNAVLAAIRDSRTASALPCPCVEVGDIGPETDWRRAVGGIEVVVHLAARTHIVYNRAADPLALYRHVNVGASVRLAQQAADAGVRRMVFVSSIKVNGESTTDGGFTESDIPRPGDPYGFSKLEAEQQLRSICARSTMQLTILRPPLLYGPGVKGNLLALVRAIHRGMPLPIGAVRNRRTLLGIDNMVSAILVCLDHPRAADSIFLVGDERPVSAAELARTIGDALGTRTHLVPVPIPLLRLAGVLVGRAAAVARLTSSLVVDSSRIREQLGWRPVRSFADGIADMARWYLAQNR